MEVHILADTMAEDLLVVYMFLQRCDSADWCSCLGYLTVIHQLQSVSHPYET